MGDMGAIVLGVVLSTVSALSSAKRDGVYHVGHCSYGSRAGAIRSLIPQVLVARASDTS